MKKTPLHYYLKQFEERKRNPLPESYTNYLFSKGEDKNFKENLVRNVRK